MLSIDSHTIQYVFAVFFLAADACKNETTNVTK